MRHGSITLAKLLILSLKMMQQERYTKRRLLTSYLTTTVSITLVLFLLGLTAMMLLYASVISRHVRENIAVSVFIEEGVTEAQVSRLQKQLDASDWVKSTKYISADEAAKIMQEELGEDFISFLGVNPLLPSIEVNPKAEYAHSDSLAKVSKKLTSLEEVKEIHYQKSLVDAVNENVKQISIGLLVLSGVLLFISLALINNTIRLSVFSRRFLIRSMMLVGASWWFIQKPFIYRGILQGLISALLANVLLGLVLYLGAKEFPDIINIDQVNIFATVFSLVLLLGLSLTWVSNYLAVRKFLYTDTDALYQY